jgi:hemoglobin-like flavoprotein
VTPDQVVLVQESWKAVAPISEQAAALFYGKLFELDPNVKPLFTSDIKEQGRKLMQMIGIAVNGLTRLDEILPAVEQLGVRHLSYQVVETHYDTVGTALLWTLNQGLGDQFTPAVEEAWALTYNTLADVMKTAAAKAAA